VEGNVRHYNTVEGGVRYYNTIILWNVALDTIIL
jgi:hypothetical protein